MSGSEQSLKGMVERRLSYLYTGELTSVIVFVFVSYLFNYAFPNLRMYSLYSFWASFILLEFLLIQGTIFWYAKLKRLRKENTSITPIKIVRQLYRFKRLNIMMIIVTIIAFVFDFIKWYPLLPIGGLSITLLIYAFAILEFINYFYIQLSYGKISDIRHLLKSRKWKKSCLNKDFRRLL
jgi:hypothetical protein